MEQQHTINSGMSSFFGWTCRWNHFFKSRRFARLSLLNTLLMLMFIALNLPFQQGSKLDINAQTSIQASGIQAAGAQQSKSKSNQNS